MDLTKFKPHSPKTLDEACVLIATAMLSISTLHNIQVQLVESGLLPEDIIERCNVIAYDLKRLLALHQKQIDSMLDLLPQHFDPKDALNKLIKQRKKKLP